MLGVCHQRRGCDLCRTDAEQNRWWVCAEAERNMRKWSLELSEIKGGTLGYHSSWYWGPVRIETNPWEGEQGDTSPSLDYVNY